MSIATHPRQRGRRLLRPERAKKSAQLVVGLRALTFVALFQAVGTAIFLALFEDDVAPSSAERIRLWSRVAAMTALVVTVFYYVLTPARMAGNPRGTFDPSLESLLLESSSGTANIVRVVGLALLALSLDRRTRLNTIAANIGAALAIASDGRGVRTQLCGARHALRRAANR